MKISKSILKKELKTMGFKLIGNYISTKDIDRICADSTDTEIDSVSLAKDIAGRVGGKF